MTSLKQCSRLVVGLQAPVLYSVVLAGLLLCSWHWSERGIIVVDPSGDGFNWSFCANEIMPSSSSSSSSSDDVCSPGEVVWYHAVNSMVELDNALRKVKEGAGHPKASRNEHMPHAPHMLEADVGMGSTSDVIMAHPPKKTSDLTLKEFVSRVAVIAAEYNVGIKLDFKDPEAVEKGLHIVKANWPTKYGALWLNADVFQGPGGNPPVHDPDDFVDICKTSCPHATLSLGYTVGFTMPWNAGYTQHMIDEMAELCEKHQLPAVTFALAAAHASQYPQRLSKLVDSCPQYTFTMWGEADQKIESFSRSLRNTHIDLKPANTKLEWQLWLARKLRLFN